MLRTYSLKIQDLDLTTVAHLAALDDVLGLGTAG